MSNLAFVSSLHITQGIIATERKLRERQRASPAIAMGQHNGSHCHGASVVDEKTGCLAPVTRNRLSLPIFFLLRQGLWCSGFITNVQVSIGQSQEQHGYLLLTYIVKTLG
jgi:hypothetical protein